MSRKVLYLTESESWSLAINLLKRFKKFWKNERDESIAEEDEFNICSKKSNLSNSHVENDKEKNKRQNINLKSLREENPNRPILDQININLLEINFTF